MRADCAYCINGHKFVCDCGHPHDHHVYGGGCKRLNCMCSGYSQSKQRLPNESDKEFEIRILSREALRSRMRSKARRTNEPANHSQRYV
jgi:hypothetical protein